jgi:biopolymer transport protein ExbD
MAAPKKRRIPIAIDMTPMVDIAFLLLIFFMSTTVFKKPTEVEVQIPMSHSTFKLPETGMIVITVTKNSDIYMSMENAALDYANCLSEQVAGTRQLHGVKWTADQIPEKIHQLQIARLVNRVVIRADRQTPYSTIESVMETLQKNDLNILNLVTDLEDERGAAPAQPGEPGKPTASLQ